jgi:hypothetical protein
VLGGDAIEGPWDGEDAITLLPDLEAGATGSMTGGGYPDGILQVAAPGTLSLVIPAKAGTQGARMKSDRSRRAHRRNGRVAASQLAQDRLAVLAHRGHRIHAVVEAAVRSRRQQRRQLTRR